MDMSANDMWTELLDRFEFRVEKVGSLTIQVRNLEQQVCQTETRLKAAQDAGDVARREAHEAKAKLDAALTLFTEDQKTAWEKINTPADGEEVVF